MLKDAAEFGFLKFYQGFHQFTTKIRNRKNISETQVDDVSMPIDFNSFLTYIYIYLVGIGLATIAFICELLKNKF